jgi:hypothetical protein
VSDVQNAYASDLASAQAGIEADKMSALLNQYNQDRSYGLDVAGLTGYLGNQRTLPGQSFDRNIFESDRNFGRGVLESDRNYNRGVLESDRNYDRGVLESDRNFDYQKARDAIADARDKRDFDEDMRRYGLDYALQRQVQLGNLSINQAQLALSRSNSAADNARADKALAWQMDPNNPDNQRSSGASGGSSGGAKYDFRTDPEFTKEIAFISSNPDRALTEIQNNAQELIQTYGYDGYQELIKEATRKR